MLENQHLRLSRPVVTALGTVPRELPECGVSVKQLVRQVEHAAKHRIASQQTVVTVKYR